MRKLSTASFRGFWRALFVRTEHVTDADIAGFLDGDLSPEEKRVVETHLEGCSDCRTATADVSRLARSYDGSVDIPDPLRIARKARLTGVPLLAAVVLAASVAFVVLGRSSDRQVSSAPVRSTGIGGDSRPFVEVTGPAEFQPVARTGLTLSWRAAGAELYRISVFDASGTPVLVRETTDTTLAAGPLLPASLDTIYLWRVDAVAAGLIATSGVRTIRVMR